jgi:molybdopterin-binding protein
VQKLFGPREAATIPGISHSTLKLWIYQRKLKSQKTRGGHHRVPETEIARLFPQKLPLHGGVHKSRRNFRKISGRNHLVGRVVEVKYSGLLAHVKLAAGEQRLTSIISADAAKELRLKPGEQRQSNQVYGNNGLRRRTILICQLR